MILKFYCIFSIIFIIVYAKERSLFRHTIIYDDNDERNFQNECQQELNASEDDLRVLTLNEQMPKYRIHYCLLGCYYRKIGLFDERNYIDFDKAIEDVRDLQYAYKDLFQRLIYIMKDCIHITIPDDDVCVATEQYFACLIIGSAKLKYRLR